MLICKVARGACGGNIVMIIMFYTVSDMESTLTCIDFFVYAHYAQTCESRAR